MWKGTDQSHTPNAHSPARKSTNGKLKNMQGGFMIRHSRLTALGILLCLLAALFALEAKLAWYSPAGSAGAQISYAKARPAEPSKALPQRFASPDAPASDFAGTANFIPAALLLAVAPAFVLTIASAHPKVSVSPGFCSSLFYRPPPVL
jgi:hypothetical protein